MDKKKVRKVMDEIIREHGKGSIYTLGSKNVDLGIARFSTGIEELDNIIGGGMPKGRILEVFGPESAGKTSVALHICAQVELSLIVPIEGTFDSERAKLFGNKDTQMIIRRPDWGEQVFDVLLSFAKTGIQLMVVDSVPAMITRDEFEQSNMEKSGQPGRIAALMSRNLPKLANICEKTGTTVIFVNQIRDVIGGFAFAQQTHTPGGHALKHYSSLRIQVSRKQWLETSKKKKIGQILKLRVVKSKVCNPYGECEIPLIFDKGFVSFEELDAMRKSKKKV